jgi:hypothetical protein
VTVRRRIESHCRDGLRSTEIEYAPGHKPGAFSADDAVTGCDAAELLEPVDAPLDQIAPLVGRTIIVDHCLPVRSGRDHGLDASLGQIVTGFVGVITLISEEPIGRQSMRRIEERRKNAKATRPPTRNMPSIRRSCGRTSMQPA